MVRCLCSCFFTEPATTEIYTLSLHDALPISRRRSGSARCRERRPSRRSGLALASPDEVRLRPRNTRRPRSEEHTSELQSHHDLVCRLLLEKKNDTRHTPTDARLISNQNARLV